MYNHKLILLLKTLSGKEIKELDAFLRSPYFNTNRHLVEIFQLLKKAHPDFQKLENKEALYKRIHPGKKFRDVHLRQYFSALTSLVEEFLAIRKFEREKTLYRHALLEEMIDRNTERLFNHTLLKTNDKSKSEDDAFYLSQFQLEDLRNKFLVNTAQQQNRFAEQPDYAKAIRLLDTFYIIRKLKFYCSQLNYKTIAAVDKETILMDEILELLSKKDYSETPAIDIYHKILRTLTEPENEENFASLLQTLKSKAHLFPQMEAREMYIYAQNFCIRQINKGKTKFLNEILDIYRILLEREIILEKGILSPWDYKNIVVTALRLNEFQWTEKFINAYKSKLPEAERENAYTYNLAKYYFYKKDYSQVLQLLQNVEYSDVFYSLDSKSMLLKTYYELNEMDSLDSMLDSFKIYLLRNKSLSEHHVKTYKNLLKITHKLSRLISSDKKKIALLETEIEQTKPLADVGWLREKILELKQ